MSLAEQKQNIVDDFTKLVEKHKDEILQLCIKNNPDIIKYIKEGQLVDTSCMTTSAYVKKNIVNKVREIGGVEITYEFYLNLSCIEQTLQPRFRNNSRIQPNRL